MNTLGISTDPSLLNVELSGTLTESASVSTFLPEEESSIYPLLGSTTPLTFSHPLTPSADNDSNASTNLCNEDGKREIDSSTSSSSGIGINVTEATQTNLFGKHNYQHLQAISNGNTQEHNGHTANGNITLTENTPSFVSWNWPLLRKCTFFVFMSCLLAMCSIVVAMIVTLPKVCNPRTAWYRGSVFYEIFPSSFQDSNNDGIGDLRGIASRIDYLKALGVSAVRLNSIFATPHYPHDYEDVLNIENIAPVLGEPNSLLKLSEALHSRNISLIIDLPVKKFLNELQLVTIPTELKVKAKNISDDLFNEYTTHSSIYKAIKKWLQFDVDGFYLKGLEDAAEEIDLAYHLAEWKKIIGSDRIIIINNSLLHKLPAAKIGDVLAHVDLVDVHLNIYDGAQSIEEQILAEINGYLKPEDNAAWIQWSINSIDNDRPRRPPNFQKNITIAGLLMQLMLPGTPNIFYGDEIALENVVDAQSEHNDTKHLQHIPIMHWFNSTIAFTNRETIPWLPHATSFNLDYFKIVTDMINLREHSPSIYKNAICKAETTLSNTQIRHSHDDILVLERIYPRRNSFVAVSNFGAKKVSVDMTSMYYSGVSMLDGTTTKKRIYFKNLEIEPLETIIIKLDK